MTAEEVATLDDSALRIKVAELCGWKRREVFEPSFANPSKLVSRGRKWHNPINDLPQRLPDYPNDLNPMFAAERYLQMHKDSTLWPRYIETLARRFESHVHLSARQRAEVFVATLTK